MVVADYGQPEGAQWEGVRTYRAYGFQAGLPVLRFLHPRWTSVWSAMRRADAQLYYVSCAGMLIGEVAMYARHRGRRSIFRIAHDNDCQPDKLLIPYWRDKWLYRYGLRRSDLILAQSASQRWAMQRNYQRDSLVVPSLVEAVGSVLQLATRDTDVLWISNIRSFKRPDLALELARQNPSITVRLIGGTQPGEKQYYQQIQREAAQVPNVLFDGQQPYEAVNERLAHTRVFINTSDSEGFPNTYLQAWARGTPVVAFFDPDGVIAREGLGEIVHSVEEMGEAVRRLLTEPRLWSELSRRCQDYVASKHGETALAAYADALGALAAAAE